MASLDSLLLPPGLRKKLLPMEHIEQLYVLRPAIMQSEFKINQAQWDTIAEKLRARGLKGIGPFPAPKPKVVREPSLKGRCKKLIRVDGTEAHEDDLPDDLKPCRLENHPGKQSCTWHWLASQPIAEQVSWADQRHSSSPAVSMGRQRSRVPAEEWPEGERWCSGCQDFVPLFYTRGSRCIAHASAAAHASMIKKVYELTADDYNNLLAWQRGRCYICQQTPRVKRLAVDHDHNSGEVRGLLCANDEWGCNRTLARVLNNIGMAERLLEYVQKTPIQRWRDGEPSPEVRVGLAARVGSRAVSDRFSGFLDG